MKEASRDIEMYFDNAHHSRLLATLTRRCRFLHYSGHGHPTFLPFEDGMGGPNWCLPSDKDTDTEAMLDIICKSLKQDKCLIVFDRTELLEKYDKSQELPMILSTILYETKQVKVVITAHNTLGQPSIGGQVEHPYNFGPTNVCKYSEVVCQSVFALTYIV
jgi:hypothetical protein